MLTDEQLASLSREEREMYLQLRKQAELDERTRIVPPKPQPIRPAPVEWKEPEKVEARGFIPDIPLGPPPGLRWIDAQLDAADRRDRAELIEKELAVRKIDEAIKSRAK
jgi:hypothetical protein